MKLRIKSKIASAHRKMEITGSGGQVLYRVHSKVVSLHGTTFLTRENGDEVAVITASPMSLRDTHRIEMADGSIVDIRTELLHLTKDVLDIDALGWYLSGDLVQHNYKLMGSGGRKPVGQYHGGAGGLGADRGGSPAGSGRAIRKHICPGKRAVRKPAWHMYQNKAKRSLQLI